ncbi:MAG: AAA family ATPase [Salinivirgaceae bacterium]|nr:AAA family ATPase [Salinivirgaceae bacterium]
MEKLLSKSLIKYSKVALKFKRYLFAEINLNHQLINITGARGTGKTTLLLQIAAQNKQLQLLYVALDDLFFSDNTLYDLAENFVKLGGELLCGIS